MLAQRRKLIETITIVFLFVVGFTLGAVYGNVNYNKKKVSQKTALAISFMNSRISETNNDAKMTFQAISEYRELFAYASQMQMITAQSYKAIESSMKAVNAADNLQRGKNITGYKELFNKQVISYSVLSSYTSLVSGFLAQADSFLSGKKVEDYTDMAFWRDIWSDYLLIDAVLKEDGESILSWVGNHKYLLSAEASKSYYEGLPDEVRKELNSSYFINKSILEINQRSAAYSAIAYVMVPFSERAGIFVTEAVSLPLISLDDLSLTSAQINNSFLSSIAVTRR